MMASVVKVCLVADEWIVQDKSSDR